MMSQPDQEHAQTLLRQLAVLLAGKLDPASLPPGIALEIAELAVQQGLSPMLLWSVAQGGGDPQSPPWAPAVVDARRCTILYLVFQTERVRIQAALDAAGIPNLWLKGIQLAHTVYPEPNLRPMVDLDVLVPYPQRQAALKELQALGYRLHLPEIIPGIQDELHAYSLVGGKHNQIMVELHSHIVGTADHFLSRAGLAWFWTQVRQYTWRDQTFASFSPEATFLHLCAHAILQHGSGEISLRQFFDLYLMLREQPDLDWPLVVKQALHFGWGGALRAALEITRAYFPVEIPPALGQVLNSLPPSPQVPGDPRHPQPLNRWESTLRDLQRIPWRERVHVMWALVFPPFAYMRWRYGVRHNWQLPYTYLFRWKDVLGEVVKTVTRRGSRLPRH